MSRVGVGLRAGRREDATRPERRRRVPWVWVKKGGEDSDGIVRDWGKRGLYPGLRARRWRP